MSTDGPCNCATSKIFPHRMSKCSMKKTVSNVSSFNPASSFRNLVNQAEVAALNAAHMRSPNSEKKESASEARSPGPSSPVPMHSPSATRTDRSQSSVPPPVGSPAEATPHHQGRQELTQAPARNGIHGKESGPLVTEHHSTTTVDPPSVPAERTTAPSAHPPVEHTERTSPPAPLLHTEGTLDPEPLLQHSAQEQRQTGSTSAELALSAPTVAAAPTLPSIPELPTASIQEELLEEAEESMGDESMVPAQNSISLQHSDATREQPTVSASVVTAEDSAPLPQATHVFVPEASEEAEPHILSAEAAVESEPVATSAGRETEDLNAQCRCVTSKVFPHRVGKCTLRRTGSTRQAAPAASPAAVPLAVPAVAMESEYVQKAKKLDSPGGTYASPPQKAPTKISGSSEHGTEVSSAVRMALNDPANESSLCRESSTPATPEQGKPKDPPCKCASSMLFPHRRSKCQLRKTSNDVSKTVKSVSKGANKLATRKKKPARQSAVSAEAAALVPMPTHVLLRAPQEQAASTMVQLVKTTAGMLLKLLALVLVSFGATNLVLHLLWRLLRRLLRL